MTAFRLIKKGRITRRTGRQIVGWHPFGVRRVSRNLGVPSEPGTRYTFTEEDIDNLNEMDFVEFQRLSDLISNVDGVGNLLYDITTKPPGTIEWE